MAKHTHGSHLGGAHVIRSRQRTQTALFPHSHNSRFLIPKRGTLAAVPDVVDTAEATAVATLAAANFTAQPITTANDAVIIIGNVISQSPAAGVLSTTFGTVAIVVSLGP